MAMAGVREASEAAGRADPMGSVRNMKHQAQERQ